MRKFYIIEGLIGPAFCTSSRVGFRLFVAQGNADSLDYLGELVRRLLPESPVRTTLRTEVERYLTGKETEPWEIIYFKLCKSQLPVVEQALETTALMLGSDKSRGYCLEMICAGIQART